MSITTNDTESAGTLRQVGPDSWQLGDASLRVARPAPGVIVYRFGGRMLPEFVPTIRSIAEAALRPGGRISVFFDTEKMTGYHPEFRSQMNAWHEETKDVTRSAGVFVSSRVISMAIAVASLVSGGKLKSYSDRIEFDEAIDRAVHGS